MTIDGGSFEDRGVRYRYLALPHRPRAAPAALTSAQRDIVHRVTRGESNAEIARGRGTSARTVANQIRTIYSKLGVSSRWELISALVK